MSDRDEPEAYPATTLFPIERANASLHRQAIYAVTSDLVDINVFPVGYHEPAQAVEASADEQDWAVAHLSLADRFVWLGDEQVDALISALELSRAATLARRRGQM